jgi:hypothetical protein
MRRDEDEQAGLAALLGPEEADEGTMAVVASIERAKGRAA